MKINNVKNLLALFMDEPCKIEIEGSYVPRRGKTYIKVTNNKGERMGGFFSEDGDEKDLYNQYLIIDLTSLYTCYLDLKDKSI